MILVTDAKYRMTVSLVQALGREGYPIAVCWRSDESALPLASYSCYVEKKMCIGCQGDQEYGEKLLSLLKKERERTGEKLTLLAVSATTIAIVAKRKAEFAEQAHILVSDFSVLCHANDKAAVASTAKALGISTPEEYHKENGEREADFFKRVPFPCVVKPHCGEQHHLKAAERYVIAHNFEELGRGYLRFLALGEVPIVQEYVQGTGVGVSVVMNQKGEAAAVFCHRRVREYPLSGGPSTCCESFYDEALAAQTVQLLQKMQFVGIAMVEYKGRSGDYRLLEINPRVWGTFPLTVKAYSQFAKQWVKACQGQSEGTSVSYERGKRMQFVVSDAMAMLSLVKKGKWAGAWQVVWDFFDPSVAEGVRDSEDKLPFRKYLQGLFHR